jgi:hypothetical protein
VPGEPARCAAGSPWECALAACGKQILDISEADIESVVEPGCVTDDFAWIAVSVIEGAGGFHAARLEVMGSR